MLTRHKVIFLVVIVAVNIALALGFYSNTHLDNMLDDVDTAGVVSKLSSAEERASGREQEYERLAEPDESYWTRNWHRFMNWLRDKVPLLHWQSAGLTDEEAVADRIEERIGQRVEKDDLLKASAIIMKKLNDEEILFLYGVGNKENPTRDELQEVRQMLLNKLTPEEIGTLRALGAKYGKELRVLDPSVPLD